MGKTGHFLLKGTYVTFGTEFVKTSLSNPALDRPTKSVNDHINPHI